MNYLNYQNTHLHCVGWRVVFGENNYSKGFLHELWQSDIRISELFLGPKKSPNKICRPQTSKGRTYFTSKLFSTYPELMQNFRQVGAMKHYISDSACKFNSSHASKLSFTPPALQGRLWRYSLTLEQIPTKVVSFTASYYSVINFKRQIF